MRAKCSLLGTMVLLTFCSVIILHQLAIAGGNRSVRLNNYNNWGCFTTPRTSTDEAIALAAQRDNVVITEKWPFDAAERIKKVNPRAKVYMYYALCVKNITDDDSMNHAQMLTPVRRTKIESNDWWLRDGAGETIKETNATLLLDVGKPGFKEEYLKDVLAGLAIHKVDGVVFDYWLPHPWSLSYVKKHAAGKYTNDTWFEEAWQPYVRYVTNGCRAAGYRVIGNSAGILDSGSKFMDWQRTNVDGVIYERWSVNWADKGGGWLPPAIVEQNIRGFNLDTKESWTADHGLRADDPMVQQEKVLSLAMYYVAVPESPSARRSFGYYGSRGQFWDPLWDFYIGKPLGSPIKSNGEYFWSRKFSQGLVLLNYDNHDISYTLDGKYHDSSGTEYSGDITVSSHSGLILAQS